MSLPSAVRSPDLGAEEALLRPLHTRRIIHISRPLHSGRVLGRSKLSKLLTRVAPRCLALLQLHGAWLATYNWARNFGWFLQRAWLRGDTTVFHDSSAIIASKGNGSSAMKAIQNVPSQSEKTFEKDVFDNFCKKFVFGHIRSKDTKPFYELYRRGKKNRCVKDAPDDPRQCYNLGAYLEGTRTPPCFKLLHADIKLNDSR